MNELSMKSDKKLPNLKVPVKGKKGVSKYMRKKLASTAKDDVNASVQSADRKPEKYMKPDGKMGIRMVKVDKEVIKKEASVLKPTKPTDIIKHAKTLAKNPRDYMMNKKKYLDKARAKVFRMYPKEEVELDEKMKYTHAAVDNKGLVIGFSTKQSDAKDMARRNKGKVVTLKKPMAQKKGDMMINRPLKEAINHDDAHRDAQTHSDGSMSVKKIPSMIKKPGDKHLHLHMKSYHKEKDGQDFAKKHGYKVKNYVKTPSGTRMDIHKEEVSVDEALTLQQRMKRSRLMKRLKTKIKIGRQRAMRKMANKKTLEKRSMRQARNQIAKKLTRGIPKAELTFARKQEIEKRLEKPALKQRIKRIAKRLFKDVRKKEVQRKKG